ncbi:MAG: 4Fe-4S binding protein [Clostridia bacterium]|jgi:pyruvate ferredoxin oxidoreductase delta subunit|nr:4Fe-4S binding protein [Clostridia bacterium]
MTSDKLNKNTPWQDLTPGGEIYTAGNSMEFKTGDWRSVKPVFLPENCKQCGLCFPVCPDNAIPVNKDLQREDFNYDYCKGCGVCAKTCPFNAIIMKEEGIK